MSRYMTHREMSELDEIVRELRDSGEITDTRPRPRGEPERTEDYISLEDLFYGED